MSEEGPVIQFDESRAMRYSPIKRLEIVRVVEKPDDQMTVIETKSGRHLAFGTYVEIFNPETSAIDSICGYDYFIETHTPWEGVENGWYYSDPIDAYQADAEGELAASSKGGTQHVNIGDWIVRDESGGIWRVNPERFTPGYDLDSARPIPQEPGSGG